MKRLVIIPTYNEKENIEAIIKAVFGLPVEFHVLVIDDGSPDGTAAIVKRMIGEQKAERLFIVERSSGQLRTSTTTSSRWTQTSRTTPMIWSNYTRR